MFIVLKELVQCFKNSYWRNLFEGSWENKGGLFFQRGGRGGEKTTHTHTHTHKHTHTHTHANTHIHTHTYKQTHWVHQYANSFTDSLSVVNDSYFNLLIVRLSRFHVYYWTWKNIFFVKSKVSVHSAKLWWIDLITLQSMHSNNKQIYYSLAFTKLQNLQSLKFE